MDYVRLGVKLIISGILFLITGFVGKIFLVPYTNEIALNQLQNINDGFYAIETIGAIKNYIVFIPVLLSFIILWKEIKVIFKKLKENLTNEEI